MAHFPWRQSVALPEGERDETRAGPGFSDVLDGQVTWSTVDGV